MCKLVYQGKGKIVNNQIHVQNIVRVEEKEFNFYDWGCAGMLETLKVQGNVFSKPHLPLCR